MTEKALEDLETHLTYLKANLGVRPHLDPAINQQIIRMGKVREDWFILQSLHNYAEQMPYWIEGETPTREELLAELRDRLGWERYYAGRMIWPFEEDN